MKRQKGRVLAASVLAAGMAMATTVTVNAPAGTSTNVTQVFSGDTSVTVNTGATGGTVRLSPHSTHAGGTTLSSGTLDVQQESQLGGSLTFLGGNFRYSGPAGAVWTTAITNSATTTSQNWRIDSDLTMAGDMWSTDGLFVKTGPATLTLAAPFYLGAEPDNIGSRGTLINLSDDRAPTTGMTGATFAEGTVVVDTPYDTAVTNKFSNNGGASLVAVRTTNAVNEATLIVSNGITRTHAALVVGAGYAKTGSSYVKGTLKVAGGTLIVGNTDLKILYTCANSYPANERVEGVVDVSSAQRLYCKCYCPAFQKNSYSLTYIHDGGNLYNLDGNIVPGYSDSNIADASTTNDFIITGSGSHVSCQNFYNDWKNGGMTTNLRLADGACLEMRNFTNSVNGKFNVVFDGGIWRHRSHNSSMPHFPSLMTSMKIGPGGLITYFNGGSEAYPVLWDKGLEPLDDSGTDGGISLTQGGSTTPLVIRGVNTYCGPTYIAKTRVYLGGAGRLPSGTALTVTTGNGGLIVTNGAQTVGSFTFGTEGTTYSPILGFDRESRLDVTGDVTLGTLLEPQLHLLETRGPTNHVENGLSTPGTYTFVTAPAASLDVLNAMAKKFTFPYKPEGVEYESYATLEDGRAKLKVIVTATSAYGTATADGTTLILPSTTANPLTPTAEQLAAAQTILANPQPCDSGSGTVELGALGGFAAGGQLVAGSGTTRVSDLSFVQSPDDLVLTTGSLVYDGPSMAIPGFTLDGITARCPVLNVERADATLSIRAVNDKLGAFTKMGDGTLHFGGTGTYEWRSENRAFNSAVEAGVAANGDGPERGFRCFNVNGGEVTIGTLGDPTDAPTLVVPHELGVGSRSHQAGQGVQTAGAMTLNNGVLDVRNTFLISYYSGNPADQPDAMLYPTFTLNGGEAYATALRLGHGSSNQTSNPTYIQHGGTNTVQGAVYVGYHGVHTQGVYRAKFLVDGGLFTCGDHIYMGTADKSMGSDVIITNGGTVVTTGDLTLNHKNTAETNTFILASGGTLRCCQLITGSPDFAYPAIAYFDGGILQPLTVKDTTTYLRYIQHAYLGANGLTVDLSHEHEYDGTENRWMCIYQAFEPDPDLPAGVPDGGITFTGRGNIATWTGFEKGTFTGGIHVRNGARYVIAGDYAAPFAADFAPGTIASSWIATNTIGSLTLGAAGATEPVTLEVRVDTAGAVGVVVSNALSILSPVAVTTRSGQYDLDCVPRVGTYTALVYSASNADVDLSLFEVAPGTRFTMTTRQETIAGGALDGMKAVVVTFASAANAAGGGPVWTSVSAGGAWADSANWNNFAAPSGEGAWAVFNPATKANVPVTLAAPVTVGAFDFAASKATYGYTLSGGSVTLGGDGHPTRIINTSGTNTVASPMTIADNTSVETTSGNELRLTGGVSGSGDLSLNKTLATGAGRVNLSLNADYAGKVTTGSGRVVVDDLSFIQTADQLTLGLGTFLYTGGDVAIPGFQISAGAERAAIFENTADVTVDSLTVSGTSAFLKLGTGTLRLHGTGTLSINTKKNYVGNAVVAANGDAPNGTTRGITVGTGTMVQGEVDDDANAPTVNVAANELTIGSYTTQGDATYVLNNGTLTGTSSLYLGYYAYEKLTVRPVLRFVQNGGVMRTSKSLNVVYCNNKYAQNADAEFVMNGGTAWFGEELRISYDKAKDPDAQYSRFVVNDGVIAFAKDAYFAYATYGRTNKGYVELNGGLFAVTGNVDFVRYAGGYAEARLNTGAMWEVGGVLTQSVENATGILYGNGGTLRPLGLTAEARTVSALTHVYASTNGLVVDTSRFASDAEFTFAQAIETDPALGAMVDGGLVKRGKGVLALSSSNNTFTGPAHVEGGVLKADVANALANATVELAGGGFVVGCGTATVGGLAGGGLVQGGDLVVTGALAPAADLDGYFYLTGALTVAAGAALDVSSFDDGSLSPGNRLFIAAAEGAITVPPMLRLQPASKLAQPGLQAKTSVEDGCLYVTISSGGTMLLFR